MTSTNRKVIVVTGASRGIGLAYVRHIVFLSKLDFQFDIVMTASKEQPLMAEFDKLLNEINENGLNHRLLPIVADLSENVIESCRKIKEKIIETFESKIDTVLFNAAVLTPLKKVSNMSDDDYKELEKLFSVNLLSVIKLANELIPMMNIIDGKFFFMSSGAALKGMSACTGYCVSKAGLNMFCQTLALENPHLFSLAISPGPVETRMQQFIRNYGHTEMSANDYNYCIMLHQDGKLNNTELLAAKFINACCLLAPREWNGEYLHIKDEKAINLINQYEKKFC
ncbi:unnamed protein product [Didymodactylos carnosus]|uniref:Sepiapterin reductase n=1 Tax=Didymodactylos carnosus TaxID=1234261 RepID=A0A814H810_9BILA|nr:unnamed protein product [Didymodactylos carnosus]CAF1007086.1 unnamed protein product [Didymodactylos carnosus]CAF3541358.1 unnamed protein product [Didymodactylos carnosus]CAF3778298.1 unnamed protein product [Didymodactylos carnosus]